MAKFPSNIGVGVAGYASIFIFCRQAKLMTHFVVSPGAL
jgi:hypothetical protein